MLNMISDNIRWLRYTTYVMIVEDDLDVIVLEGGQNFSYRSDRLERDCVGTKIKAGHLFKWVR